MSKLILVTALAFVIVIAVGVAVALGQFDEPPAIDLSRFDLNDDCVIDRSEVITAINNYLDGDGTPRDTVIEVIYAHYDQRSVCIVAPTPTPTPTPEPPPTPTLTPTATPVPTQRPTLTPEPTATRVPEPTATSTPTLVPPTATPIPYIPGPTPCPPDHVSTHRYPTPNDPTMCVVYNGCTGEVIRAYPVYGEPGAWRGC